MQSANRDIPVSAMKPYAISLVCVLLLLNIIQDVSTGWLDKLGEEAKRIGDQISNVAQKAKDDVVAEYGRFENSIGPETERWKDQISTWDPSVHRGSESETSVTSRIDNPDDVGTKCHPLSDPSMDFSCHLEGTTVNCSEPLEPGTVADFRCRVGYVYAVYPGYKSVTCSEAFKWSKPIIKCVPDCGRPNVGAKRLVSLGEEVPVGEFPWHVGIYRLNKTNQWEQICGGTLISPSLIISAAHCFWDHTRSKPLLKENHSIVAGKQLRDWYTDEPAMEKRNLSEIIVHERYLGHRRNLAYDLAMLRVDRDVLLTASVNTACIDWEDALEDQHLVPGNNGSIAGWGVTENNTHSDVLRFVRLPFVPFDTCSDVVAPEFLRYLTHDKMCAGWINKGISVCPGDSGGGYAFPQATERGIKYYLRGIASVGHRANLNSHNKCQMEQVSGFTLISTYRKWIEKIVYP